MGGLSFDMLEEDDAGNLKSNFMKEEVLQALKSIDEDKPSSPDRFSFTITFFSEVLECSERRHHKFFNLGFYTMYFHF